MKEEYITVLWYSHTENKYYSVGVITRKSDNTYEFVYAFDIEDIIEKGYRPFECFENPYKAYSSDALFPVFASRVPPRNRIGIERILDKYGLDEYDEFELLRASGGVLPTDNLKFVAPR